jgi:Putative Flp pilus-assembly TadE/G-like
MTNIGKLLQRIWLEKRGNVFMMTGFAIIPLVAATGMGVDYTRAARTDTKLSAAADAAALAAVSDTMMLKTETQAADYAKLIFNQQAALIPDLIYDPATLNVSVTHTGNGATISDRIVSITFSGKSRNIFGSILGLSTLEVGGVAGSKASRAPNIDFYLLMDSSPSMALPVTSAGLTKMKDMTGCAFACHLTQPHSESIYIKDNATFDINKTMNIDLGGGKTQITADGAYKDAAGDIHNPDGTFVDSVWLAKNTRVPMTLRIDEERTAVISLMAYAKAQALSRGATYRAALFSFNYGPNFTKLFPAGSTVVTSDLDGIAAQAPNIELMQMYTNGCPTSSFCNDDMETDFYTALDKMKSTTRVPTPGNGTNAVGDKPQGIVFIVTDGMSDEDLSGRTHREMQATHIAQCQAIKNRGLKIAILYTKYLPESITGNGWSLTNVGPYLEAGGDVPAPGSSAIPDALRSCASPGLMYTVTTNQSITAALEQLFKESTKSAHLAQ